MPRRPVPSYARLALEVIADFKAPYMPVHQYELVMSQRGSYAPECGRALVALLRREWIKSDGLRIELTDAGWAAAAKGGDVNPPPKRSAKGSNRRMPAGLF